MPVPQYLGAGELKIQNGQVTDITMHSGHYNPTIENVHKILNFFAKQGVDISKVQVHGFEKIPQLPCTYDTNNLPCFEAPMVVELVDKLAMETNIKSLFISLNNEIKGLREDIDSKLKAIKKLKDGEIDYVRYNLQTMDAELMWLQKDIQKELAVNSLRNSRPTKENIIDLSDTADKLKEKFDAIKTKYNNSIKELL